jgi:hypothetical protein
VHPKDRDPTRRNSMEQDNAPFGMAPHDHADFEVSRLVSQINLIPTRDELERAKIVMRAAFRAGITPKILANLLGLMRQKANGKRDKNAPLNGRIFYNLTDLFTTAELNRAMILFIECKNTKEDFSARCANEIVEPAISRINDYAWQDNSTASLVYRLEMYLRSVRGEAGATHH